MLAIYRYNTPHILHIWYNHDNAMKYHNYYVDNSTKDLLSSNNRFWICKYVTRFNHKLIKNAHKLYIHDYKRIINLEGFDRTREIEIMNNYKYALTNINACVLTLITSKIPENIYLDEITTIKNKLINSSGVLKHYIQFRSAYLIH